jgi:hypothetical protein
MDGNTDGVDKAIANHEQMIGFPPERFKYVMRPLKAGHTSQYTRYYR